MPLLRSIRGDVSFQLNFLKTSFFVYDSTKNDIENWLPIYFSCTVGNETYSVSPDVNPTLNLFEIKNMLTKFRKVIETKKRGEIINLISISTYEFYYEIELFDPNEDDEIGVVLWIFEATRTNGELSGFERGFRYYVSLETLETFKKEIEQDLSELL